MDIIVEHLNKPLSLIFLRRAETTLKKVQPEIFKL